MRDITRALVDDDTEKANKLVNKYQVVPSEEMINNEILKRNLSRKERKAMKAPGKREEYRLQREGLR